MDCSFDHSVFAKNRQRLSDADVAWEFLLEIVAQARQQRLLSEEHFSVDGTLSEAWASVKSFRPRDDDPPPPEGGGRNPAVDFRGERRRNKTHRSTTDPEARLARKGKGKEARLCFGAHVLMDNREGPVVDVRLTPAEGAWERVAALEMLRSILRLHRRLPASHPVPFHHPARSTVLRVNQRRNGRVANEVCHFRWERLPSGGLPHYWTPESVRRILTAMPAGQPGFHLRHTGGLLLLDYVATSPATPTTSFVRWATADLVFQSTSRPLPSAAECRSTHLTKYWPRSQPRGNVGTPVGHQR